LPAQRDWYYENHQPAALGWECHWKELAIFNTCFDCSQRKALGFVPRLDCVDDFPALLQLAPAMLRLKRS